MSNTRTKNTVLNSIGSVMLRLMGIVTGFVTRTVFIKTLGIQYAGVSGVFSDVLTMLSFAELGIGSAIIYSLYEPIANNDETQIMKMMSAYKKIYICISGIVFTVGLCLIPFLKYIIKDVPDIVENIKIIYVLYLVNTSSSYLLIYKSTFLTAVQKDYLVSKFKIIVSLCKAVIECVLLILFKQFYIYLVFSISTIFIQNFVIAKIAEKKYPILKKKSNLHLDKNEKTTLVNNVKALALYKVSGTALNGTDSLITSIMIGTSFVGILGNYNMISNQLYQLIMAIFGSTSASIGNLAATSTKERQYEVFKKMLFLCFWFYCVCTTCLWVLFNPFVELWQGKDLMLPNLAVAMMVLELYVKGMLSPISQFRTANGLFVQGKYRPLIMAIINIVVSIILAQYIGITGILMGTVISRATTQLWYDPYLIYKKIFQIPIYKYFLKYGFYIILTLISCGVSEYLYGIVCHQNNIGTLFIGLAISLVISNFMIVAIFFRTDEFKSIIEIIKNTIKRKL